jgi:hypothetical protein
MRHTQLVIWPDIPNSDRTHVELIALKECPIEAEQFLITDEAGPFRYFMKIDVRPANISPALGREDPATFSALVKKLLGDVKTTGIEQHNILHYFAKLIGRQDLVAPGPQDQSECLTAPPLGTIVRLATSHESLLFLGLPPMDEALRFGHIFHTDIPLCVSADILRHHILMAGATGQGKTTTISNIVAAAYTAGATVFLFDLKPDYQQMEEAQGGRASRFAREDISYWNLNEKRNYRKDTVPINVHFSEIIPEVYIQKASGTELQYDVWMHMLMRFMEEKQDAGESTWTMEQFHAWMPKSQHDPRVKSLYPHEDIPHAGTLNAHYRIRRAKPAWVDRTHTSRGMLQQSRQEVSFFAHPSFLQPRHVHVIQVNAGADKDYGMFLSTLMSKVLDQKEEAQVRHPILFVIDEAEDVFAGGDFAKQCTTVIANVVRKGRSQNIGVLISVQSAANIPTGIAQNLSSVIAYRHNNDEAAGHIKKLLGKDAENLQELHPGNAIVKLFGAKTAVRARLDPEAFPLVKHV